MNPVTPLSDMMSELRRLQTAAEAQDLKINQFIADKIAPGLRTAKPTAQPFKGAKPVVAIVRELVQPLTVESFDGARLKQLCSEKHPNDYDRFSRGVYVALNVLSLRKEIQRVPGGYQLCFH